MGCCAANDSTLTLLHVKYADSLHEMAVSLILALVLSILQVSRVDPIATGC